MTTGHGDLLSLLRSTDQEGSARATFVNRHAELAALDEHLTSIAEENATGRLPAPGRNLVMVTGHGGAGKSALIAQHLDGRKAALSLDLRDPRFSDADALLLALRNAVLPERAAPVFDTAFSMYWSQAYPGIRLSGTQGNAFVEMGAAQVASTVDAVLGVPIAGTSIGLLRLALAKAKQRNWMRRAVALAPEVESWLETGDAAQLRRFLGFLLQIDLHLAQVEPAAVALDHWERMDQLRDRSPRTLDNVLRVVASLPGVQFILATRHQSPWLRREQLDLQFSGPRVWSVDRCRIVHVQPLTDDHQKLIVHELAPSREHSILAILRELPEAERGSPLVAMLAAATTARASVVADPFTAYAQHLARTLPGRELILLRIAAAAGSFDFAMLNAADPTLTRAEFEFLVDTPFIDDTGGVFPWHMHDRVAEALGRLGDVGVDASGVHRVMGELERRVPASHSEISSSIETFVLGWRLTVLTGQVPEWLYRLAYRHRLLMIDGVLSIPVAELDNTSSDGRRAFALCCLGMDLRALEDYEGAVAPLEEALALAPSGFTRAFIAHRLSKCVQVLGHYDHALRCLDLAARGAGADAELAEKDAAFLALFIDGPERADAWLQRLPLSAGIERQAQADDLRGWRYLIAGRVEEATSCFLRVVDNTELADAGVFRDSSTRHTALALAFSGSPATAAAIDRARNVNARLRKEVGLAQCDLAEVIGPADLTRADVDALLLSAERRLVSRGNRFDRYLIHVAGVWSGIVRAWPDLAAAHIAQLADLASTTGVSQTWLCVARSWLQADHGNAWGTVLSKRME